MISGFAFGGVCFPSEASAFQAFKASFPMVSDGRLTELSSSSLSGSVVTFSLRSSAESAWTTTSGTFELPACNQASRVASDYAPQIFGAMLVAFFMAFFLRKAIRKSAAFMGGMYNDF